VSSEPPPPSSAAGERQVAEPPGPRTEGALPGGDFRLFVQKLSYQALIGLGILEHPLTGSKAPDLARSRSVIDDLAMLRERTRGNLDPDEDEHLARVLRDLQHHFVRLAQRSSAVGGAPPIADAHPWDGAP
jgi:hypothetical protein